MRNLIKNKHTVSLVRSFLKAGVLDELGRKMVISPRRTRWHIVAVATALGQGLGDLAAMRTFGALLYLLFFRDARGQRARRIEPCLELTVLRFASAAWAMVSAAMVLLESLNGSRMPFTRLAEPGASSPTRGAPSRAPGRCR